MKSVMSHTFSQVPQANISRSSFNRSHGVKTTFDSGYLVPIYIDEALPGDTFNLNMNVFARLATPIVPIMDNMMCDSFFFAVPLRLIWNNFIKMMGEQTNPGDSTDYLVPQMLAPTTTGYVYGSLSDYFGIPTGVPLLTHSSLWHRAYNLIWNEWFRDEVLQTSLVVDKGDGPDLPANYILKRRGKRKDYFTSCLPWPQKGPAVTLPLGTTAIIRTNPTDLVTGTQSSPMMMKLLNGTVPASNFALAAGNSDGSVMTSTAAAPSGSRLYPTNLYADLTNATASTINQLRQAFQLQSLYEKDARGGTRYTELVRSHFGVISPDARLQRPEYLGGSSVPIIVNPIAQTSSTDAVTPQGNLAAMGMMANSSAGFTKSFTEHSVILGMVNIRADLNYQQGLNRMFSRRTRWDFYWPQLAGLGEQAVLNKEIYAKADANDDLVWGYQERFSEYKYKPSIITGKFRSTDAQPLDIWHLAQKFTALPTLNTTFIEETPPISRVVAVPSQPQMLFDAYFNLTCARPMPTYSIPGLSSHL
jgi:hypothetical protein